MEILVRGDFIQNLVQLAGQCRAQLARGAQVVHQHAELIFTLGDRTQGVEERVDPGIHLCRLHRRDAYLFYRCLCGHFAPLAPLGCVSGRYPVSPAILPASSTISAMIAHLRGQIFSKGPTAVVIECGGVGYELAISVTTYTELGDTGTNAALHVHTHVREDALQLFGFHALTEKRLFEKLLTISGIGPKLAITVLSGIDAERLVTAIRAGDHGTLTKVPGIGKKTAERVVLELKDKLDDLAGLAPASSEPAKPTLSAIAEDVFSALVNLGYQRAAALKAIETASKDPSVTANFETLFRSSIAAVR